MYIGKLIGDDLTTFIDQLKDDYQVCHLNPRTLMGHLISLYKKDVTNFHPNCIILRLPFICQVLFGNLILSDLSSLVGELLPHEFEELMAKLLSLSKKTLIVNLVNADQTMVCSTIAFLNQF